MNIRPRNGIVPWQQASPDTQHLLLLPARKAISNTIICCWCDISHIREPNVTNPLIKILFRVYSIIIKQLPMHPDHWYKAIQFQSKATWFRFWWIGAINFSGRGFFSNGNTTRVSYRSIWFMLPLGLLIIGVPEMLHEPFISHRWIMPIQTGKCPLRVKLILNK